MRKQSVPWLAGLLMLGAGCSGPKFGAYSECRFESNPSGATAYMIPQMDWDSNGQERMLGNAPMLDRFKVGTTPVTRRCPGFQHVYVGTLDGRTGQMTVQPRSGVTNVFTLSLP